MYPNPSQEVILLLEFKDFGPPENLHTALAFTAAPARAVRALEGAIGPAAGVLGFPHMVRGYRQEVVRRNISPEAFRNLVEVRVPAKGVERPLSEHGSQVRLRVLAVNFLHSQMHRTLCTCVTAVGTWARWPSAGALGPHAPFRAHPVPFSSCWCLARAGQGMQGVVWYHVLAHCPVPRGSGSVHDFLGVSV